VEGIKPQGQTFGIIIRFHYLNGIKQVPY